MLSADRRQEIAGFLRSRRERLQPEDVGPPRGARRRTPGLRREEVASLASVSTEWYKWLEQSRDVRASADTLRRIANALCLEPSENEHLLRLAGYRYDDEGNGRPQVAEVSPHIQRLIDQLVYCPTWVLGVRWDILAWNCAAECIHGDLGAMQGIERNALYQLFLSPRQHEMLVDWEAHARGVVASLRVEHARHVDDPWFNEIVDVLREGSTLFDRWWNESDVQAYQDGVKVYEHPDVGRLTFDFTVLDVADARFAELSLITYVPDDSTDTRQKMATLLDGLTSTSGRSVALP